MHPMSHDALGHLAATADFKSLQVDRTGLRHAGVSGLNVSMDNQPSLHPEARDRGEQPGHSINSKNGCFR